MSPTVLVADDSQTIRKVVQMALKGSDFEVEGASSAREAVEAVQQRPDVLLLDYYMPDGSGYDVCKRIKQNDATRDIPVVMLGGNYKEFDPDMARKSGADDVVMKPFKTDELLEALESASVSGQQARPGESAAGQPESASQRQSQQQKQQQRARQKQQQKQQQQKQQRRARQKQQQKQQQRRQRQSQSTRQSQQPRQVAQQQQAGSPGGARGGASDSGAQPPSPPGADAPSRTPVPESEPRISVNPGEQSRSPSSSGAGSQPGSRPRTPSAGSNPGSSSPQSQSDTRQRKPTPPPGSGSGAAAAGMDSDEIKEFIKQQVKETVRAELPGLLRNVMGDIFQEKVLPKLLKHTDNKIQQVLDEKLEDQITYQVRVELERLLAEE